MTPAVLAFTAADPAPRRTAVVQGEFAVSDDPAEVFTTILGSCVAACICDPHAGVGGINHFLLPGEVDSDGLRYGVNAMELLINGLLQRGARRERLAAKLFGGARLLDGLSDIGRQNAEFAEQFLAKEGIAYRGGSLGGPLARSLQYWPVVGRARQRFLAGDHRILAEAPALPASAEAGAVELF